MNEKLRLWDKWEKHAQARPEAEAILHCVAGEEPYCWRWGALLSAARRYAAALRAQGAGRGDVCALILRHARDFYPLYMGISALGALPAVLAYPNPRLHADKFRQGLEGMARRSGLDWILTERTLEPLVAPVLRAGQTTVRRILYPLEWESAPGAPELSEIPEVDPAEACLLQHSSGTTGLQKAVTLSHLAVREHLERYARAIELHSDDRVVSWLPLYHDMGLIAAFHLPLAFGIPLVQLDPFEWVLAPALMIEALARHRGTLAWLPNFAYNFMADRIHEEDVEGLSLASVRLLVNCSEPVRHESHRKFVARFAPYGLKAEVLAACYAMAETTFAVTQTVPGRPPHVLAAEREALARGQFVGAQGDKPARQCVSSGKLISGCTARISGPDGQAVPDGQIGEIVIRSVSLFTGYRNNPEATAAALKDGWYFSGDYGFRWDNEYYVIGRKKDILIVAGKNLYPEDIEDAAQTVPGVTPGRVVAFGLEDEQAGTELVCVVAETEVTGPEERKRLRLALVEAGMAIDVTISRVYLAPPRWLFKSSSGKPSRSANRQRVLDELQPV